MLNHHLLAKNTTESILNNFKTGSWTCVGGLGQNFLRVGCDATFPSPDASFYDESEKVLVNFEFKPPTETKRGILTGLGQAIAYLNDCQLSYLIAPNYLDDFRLGEYLINLFSKQISTKLPVGLILYDNNAPSNVNLCCNVDAIGDDRTTAASVRDRFWAKHQDLPLPLLHLILHCYYLKKIGQINQDAFEYCWINHMISPTILSDFLPINIKDCNGQVIQTLAGNKNIAFLEKKLKRTEGLPIDERRKIISHDIDISFVGDNLYNSFRKNFLSFIKHMGFIDSEGNLTEIGYKLYHLGLVNSPNSKIFTDYFIRELLLTGNHLDLLLDLDSMRNTMRSDSFPKVLKAMESSYEDKGYLKRNPNRQVYSTSKVAFLKYELILWRALGLIGYDYFVNWRKVTEICMMPPI